MMAGLNEDDDGFAEFLSNLLENGCVDDGAAAGITRQVIDKGPESLTEKQRYVFDTQVLSIAPRECIRGCDIPWSEKFEAMGNGGLCSWCAKMLESADKADRADR